MLCNVPLKSPCVGGREGKTLLVKSAALPRVFLSHPFSDSAQCAAGAARLPLGSPRVMVHKFMQDSPPQGRGRTGTMRAHLAEEECEHRRQRKGIFLSRHKPCSLRCSKAAAAPPVGSVRPGHAWPGHCRSARDSPRGPPSSLFSDAAPLLPKPVGAGSVHSPFHGDLPRGPAAPVASAVSVTLAAQPGEPQGGPRTRRHTREVPLSPTRDLAPPLAVSLLQMPRPRAPRSLLASQGLCSRHPDIT